MRLDISPILSQEIETHNSPLRIFNFLELLVIRTHPNLYLVYWPLPDSSSSIYAPSPSSSLRHWSVIFDATLHLMNIHFLIIVVRIKLSSVQVIMHKLVDNHLHHNHQNQNPITKIKK